MFIPATFLPTVLKIVGLTSGKEMLLAALPVLLIIPGVFDEILAGLLAIIAMLVIVIMRYYISINQAKFERRIQTASASGEMSEKVASEALHNLRELTVGN